MDKKNVPQQNISTYSGNKKAIYATDQDGQYTIVASSGWSVEEEVTRQALQELERLTEAAYHQVKANRRSPLFFHMYNRRMDLQTLAQSSGFFQWRIKRHFKPAIFKKLAHKTLARYGETLGISLEELRSIPPRHPQTND